VPSKIVIPFEEGGKWHRQRSGRHHTDDLKTSEENVGVLLFVHNTRVNQDFSGLDRKRAGFFRDIERKEQI
jgi:hypothetical protein